MQSGAPHDVSFDDMLATRLVRYVDLRPCTTAFIDTRTPGRQKKENFTIIGPGVAENPDQFVHISTPHGFNIGGARQPPGCVNSQHSHETAEVFIIHKGTWAFYLGAECEDGEVVLGPGEVISIPVHVFRGFENVGNDVGYMFAVLGGDDPGNVKWAPDVFESAAEHGLILLEDGSLVDTTKGETIPPGKKAMPATTAEDVANLRKLSADEMANCVARIDEISAGSKSSISALGIPETPVIGAESANEKLSAGKMSWPHGFNVRHLTLDPGDRSKKHSREEAEVVLLQSGNLTLTFEDGTVEMTPGDVFTVPVGIPKVFSNSGSVPAIAYVVRGGDHPAAPKLLDQNS